MQIISATNLKVNNLSCLIYGVPGIGKTTLLGNLPGKTLIIDIDRGSNVLSGVENVDVMRVSEKMNEIPEVISALKEKCEYQNIALDSVSELERGMLAELGRRGNNNGIPDQASYLRVDYKIIDWCRQFRDLPANIIFIAWERLKEYVSTSGDKYTQAIPMLRKDNSDNLCGLCDIVGRIVVNPKDGERLVILDSNNNNVAKDRIFKRKFCKPEELLACQK